MMNDEFNDVNLTPEEIRQTLTGFLGQTYREIANFDSHLVSTNPFLAPKKQEFRNLAEKVIQESVGLRQNNNFSNNVFVGTQNLPQNFIPNQQFVQSVQQIQPVPQTDPNQLEFSFDDSITAKTINSKLELLEKKLNIIDKTLSKVVEFLESYETKDKQ